jgi:hypothetical protein
MYDPIGRRLAARRQRTQRARLDELEALLIPSPPSSGDGYRHECGLVRWATATGGRAATVAAPYARLVTDHTRLLHEASEAGEITLGDRFPRLLTGQWHFTPEHQDQLDTIDEQLQAMMDDLEVLWIAAGCPKVDDR